MAKFLQLPLNDDLKKEDVELNLSDVKKENQIKIIVTERFPNDKGFWINQTIVNDLKVIFRHFKLEDNDMNDIIIFSLLIVGDPILHNYEHLPETKKFLSECSYYRAYQKLVKSKIFKKIS